MEESEIGSIFINELKDVTDRIIKEWPTSEYFFVGVGRSPAPLIADIQRRYGVSSGQNLPLSNFQYFEPTESGTVNEIEKLSEQQQTRIFQHFDTFLSCVPVDKKVVVIDFIFTGKSLLTTYYYLSRYFQERTRTHSPKSELESKEQKVQALGFCDLPLVSNEALAACGVNILKCCRRPLLKWDANKPDCGSDFMQVFSWQQAKWLAEYNQKVTLEWLMSTPSPSFDKNKFYQLFIEYLAATDYESVVEGGRSEWVILRAKKGKSE